MGVLVAVVAVVASSVLSYLAIRQQGEALQTDRLFQHISDCREEISNLETAVTDLGFQNSLLESGSQVDGFVPYEQLHRSAEAWVALYGANGREAAQCSGLTGVSEAAPAIPPFNFAGTDNGHDAYARRVADWAEAQRSALSELEASRS